MNRCLPALFLLFCLASLPLKVQFNANWVTRSALEGSEQAVVLFRTTFDLETLPDSFPIGITADDSAPVSLHYAHALGSASSLFEVLNVNSSQVED
jgi:hypothetical protein